jgi:hypothetical protein
MGSARQVASLFSPRYCLGLTRLYRHDDVPYLPPACSISGDALVVGGAWRWRGDGVEGRGWWRERERVCGGGSLALLRFALRYVCTLLDGAKGAQELMRVRSKGCGRWRSYSMRKLEEEGIQVVVRRCVVCAEEMG